METAFGPLPTDERRYLPRNLRTIEAQELPRSLEGQVINLHRLIVS
jgi:hypothetical protein